MSLKLSFVIEAVDQATAVVNRINKTVNQATAPFRKMNASVSSFLGAAINPGGVMTQRLEALKKAVGFVRSAFFGLAAGGGLLFLIRGMTNLGGESLSVAQRFGTTVEMVQKLGFAASQNRSNLEEMSDGLKDLGRNAVAAATGSEESAKWFRRAGVNIRDAKGHIKGTDQILLDLADKFSKMPDGIKKNAIANGILGRSGERLIPTLNLGRKGIEQLGKKAELLGIIMDKETAEGFDSLGKSMDNVGRAGQGVFIATLKPLLPVLKSITQGIVSWVSANRELIATGLGPVLAGIAAIIVGKLVFAIGALTVATVRLGLAFLLTPFGLFLAGVAAIAAAAYLVIKHWEPIKKFFADLWGGVIEIFNSAVDSVVDIVRFLIKTILFPFIEMLRVVNGLLPTSVRASAFGRGLQKSLDFVDNVKSPIGTSAQGIVRSPIGKGAAAQTNVGGTIRIAFDDIGRPIVRELTTDNPNVDLEVYSGQGFAFPL